MRETTSFIWLLYTLKLKSIEVVLDFQVYSNGCVCAAGCAKEKKSSLFFFKKMWESLWKFCAGLRGSDKVCLPLKFRVCVFDKVLIAEIWDTHRSQQSKNTPPNVADSGRRADRVNMRKLMNMNEVNESWWMLSLISIKIRYFPWTSAKDTHNKEQIWRVSLSSDLMDVDKVTSQCSDI